MSPPATAVVAPTSRPALDEAVAVVSEQRRAFARMAPSQKAGLLRSMLPLVGEVASAWGNVRTNHASVSPKPAWPAS